MAIDIVDAFQGKPHVTADDVGGFKAGIVGEEDYILPAGEQMKATVISNNKIRIAEGEAVMQGRHWRIKPNTYEDVTIENGAQNMNRKDAIIARYTKNADTGIEKVELAVLKGTPTSGTAIAPAQEKGNILEGTMKHEMLLYIVSLKGLNIESVTAEFNVLMNMSMINKSLSDLPVAAVYRNAGEYNIDSSSGDYKGTDFGTKVFDNIGLVYNYDTQTYKHTFTFPKTGIYLIHAYVDFRDAKFPKETALYAKLEVNNIEQSTQVKTANNYRGVDYQWVNVINAGSKMRVTLLQNSGSTIKVGGSCRLNIIRLGK